MTSPTFVVPLDGSVCSERAIPIAKALAHRAGGKLLLISAQDHGPLRPRDYLAEIATQRFDVPVETVAVTDHYPADAIVTVANESDDRIVCMTSHGRGGLRWSMVGSVAEEVVRRAKGPTFLIGRHCRTSFLSGSEMLVCVDGPEAAARLAPAAWEWSDQLALALRAAIVVHPLDVESAEHSEKLLAPIVATLGGPQRVEATMIRNVYPEGALCDYAADVHAAIMMVNSHARTGFARVALGSTTMALLHQAPCPVLVYAAPQVER